MLTLNDGRSELWQWDTGRTLTVDADCSQVHFSNKVFGRSIDVDVVDGVAIVPDILLQTDKGLNVWAFVGTAENGYTKISKTFKINRRNKPADYVFTPPDQTTLGELVERLGKIEESQDPDAIKNAVEDYLEQNPIEAPVQSVNGQMGEVKLTAEDVGAISKDDLQEATNKALAQAKASGEFDGKPGADGKDGVSATHRWSGTVLTVTSASGTSSANLKGDKGEPGEKGADGAKGDKGDPGEPGQKGDKGDQGIQGAQGEQGPKGDKGDKGDTGANGTNGSNGVSCTHSWNGTTLSVTSASGTSSANLKGEKGDKGDPGEQGIQGPKGDTGEQGPAGADGAKGDTGDTGAQGPAGPAGKTPEKGVDYFTDEDKSAMVSDVLAALPTWNGGSY